MLLQLWHVGRASHASLQPNGEVPIAPSVSGASVRALLEHGPEESTPARAIEIEEIPGIVGQYARAAGQAKAAGFDGVEIHAANGYLIDQFLQDGVNRRSDDYGGSIANRTRFLVEVVDAVTAIWGADRVGVRVGPSNSFNGMHDSDPQGLFSHVAGCLSARSIAYLHVIEPRVAGNSEVGDQTPLAAAALKQMFNGAVIAAGGFDADSARDILERGDTDLVAFGRFFIANPDLPDRIRSELPLNAYDRPTFYYGGARGYTDYPRAQEIEHASQRGRDASFRAEAVCDSGSGTLVSQHSSGTNVAPNNDAIQAAALSCRKPWFVERLADIPAVLDRRSSPCLCAPVDAAELTTAMGAFCRSKDAPTRHNPELGIIRLVPRGISRNPCHSPFRPTWTSCPPASACRIAGLRHQPAPAPTSCRGSGRKAGPAHP